MDEELSHGWIFSQSDRSIVSVLGFRAFSKTVQEMSANRQVGLRSRHCIIVDCIESGQSLFRSIRLRKRGGVSRSPAECRRYAVQLLVEPHDRCPLNLAAASPFGMYRLNRRLQLKTPWTAKFGRVCEMTFRIFY